MKKRVAMVIATIVMCWDVSAGEKTGLEPPPEGKAVVYVGRLTGFYGRARPFHVFHNEEYLGFLKGKNYIRIECDPGENLFWVAAENRTFVKADLEAGRAYALFAKIMPGAWSARAQIYPITASSDAWAEYREMLAAKPPQARNQKYLDKWYRNHPVYIEKALQEWRSNDEPAVALNSDDHIE